ncbi:MAG: hypothetical protein OEZ58_01710 [Gammaproteobacteria bacterium]|nr:hypothetical protein [Gammaproteobacteria bacterium]MDH5727677.1 hypothetical protein [Gammaproteobacteria bacterium]
MGDDLNHPSHWWGKYSLAQHELWQWQIGSLLLNIRCLPNEWQVAYKQSDESADDENFWRIQQLEEEAQWFENSSRYVFREITGMLSVSPLLADRPVISRPRSPFNIVAGEEVTLYVSTPLWMELGVGKQQKKLTELVIQRPSDTWFGPSTLEGELCYATTTHCRLYLDEIPQRAHRAITPVVIRNQADSTLSVERLNVPAPLLPLYATTSGQLWTPKVTLTRLEHGEMAALKIDKQAPIEAKGAKAIRAPRKVTSSGMLIRAFNAVFS